MNAERQKQIGQRRSFIPKCFRGIYDKAVQGRSLRAAVNATCLDCVCYATNEVRNCSDLSCPLWAVRPYQDISQSARNGRDTAPESTKS